MHLSKKLREMIGAAMGMAVAAIISAIFSVSSIERHDAKFGAASQAALAPLIALS